MIKNRHYSNEYSNEVVSNDDHNFLEGFDKN